MTFNNWKLFLNNVCSKTVMTYHLRTWFSILTKAWLWIIFISLFIFLLTFYEVWISLFFPSLLHRKVLNDCCILLEGFEYSILNFKELLASWEKYNMLYSFFPRKRATYLLLCNYKPPSNLFIINWMYKKFEKYNNLQFSPRAAHYHSDTSVLYHLVEIPSALCHFSHGALIYLCSVFLSSYPPLIPIFFQYH